MACYHKEWDYFSREFGVTCVDYIEPKPGIPPTPGHVHESSTTCSEKHIPVLFSTNYYDRNQVLEEVASRTGAQAVIVPVQRGGATRRPDVLRPDQPLDHGAEPRLRRGTGARRPLREEP